MASKKIQLLHALLAAQNERDLTAREGRALASLQTTAGVNDQFPEASNLAAVGRGFMDVAQGTKQFGLETAANLGLIEDKQVEDFTKGVEEEIGLFEKGRGDTGAFDASRLAGQAAPFLAALPASALASTSGLLARLGLASGVGAATAGATTFVPEGESRVVPAGIGAVGGAAALPVAAVGGKIASGLRDPIVKGGQKLINRARPGTFVDPDAATAAKNLRLSGEESRRRTQLTAAGIREPTRGQITRDPEVVAREQALSRKASGSALRQKGNEQVVELQDSLARIRGDVAPGIPPQQAGAVGQDLQQVALKRSEEMKAPVREAFKKAGGLAGQDAPVPASQFANRYADVLDEFEDAIPGPIKTRIKELMPAQGKTPKRFTRNAIGDFVEDENGEFIKRAPVFTERGVSRSTGFEPFVGTRMTAGKRDFSLFEAQKLRRMIGDRQRDAARSTSDTAPTTERALTALKKDLDDAITSIGDEGTAAAEAFKIARSEAAERFKVVNPKIIKDLITGAGDETGKGTAAEKFVKNKIMGGRIDELEELVTFATTGTPQQALRGEAVLRSVKGHVIDEFKKAADPADVGDVFNGRAFKKVVDGMGLEKMKILFGDSTAEQIKALADAAADIATQPGSTVQHGLANQLAGEIYNSVFGGPRLDLPSRLIRGIFRGGRSAFTGLKESAEASQLSRGAPGLVPPTSLGPPLVGGAVGGGLSGDSNTAAPQGLIDKVNPIGLFNQLEEARRNRP